MQQRKDADSGAGQIAQDQEPVGAVHAVADIPGKSGNNDCRQIIDQQRDAKAQAGACLGQDVPAQSKGKQLCARMGYALAQ